jgi:TatA/E family protein of Tat protein translocase
MNLGLPEIILIVLVLIIIFGSKRIADIAKDAGETKKEVGKNQKGGVV